MHPRLSLQPATTGAASLAHDIALCRKVGLARMSLHMRKPDMKDPGEVAARVRDSGLAVDFVVTELGRFNLRQTETWEEGQDRYFATLDMAERAGAPAVFTTGGGAMAMSFDAAADAFARFLEPILPEFRRRNMTLILETVRTQFAHNGFVHSLHDAVPLARRLGLKLSFDTGHNWWESGLEGLLRRERDLFRSVQLADIDLTQPVISRVNLGDGHLEFGRMLRAACPPDYQGSIDLELIGPRIEAEGYETALLRAGAYVEPLLRECGL